jgi:hypothetical protein
MFGTLISKLYLIVLMNTWNISTLHFFSAFILLVSIHANPNYDTTDNEVNKLEISTTPKQTFEDTTADQLFENKTTSIPNVTSVPIITTPINIIPNSTARSLAIQGKVVTYNTTYSYYNYSTTYYYNSYVTASSSSGSGLSGGAIAGIVIGIIVLICCCALCGAKSGHWETRKVWVEH